MSNYVHGYDPVTHKTAKAGDRWNNHHIRQLPPSLDVFPILWSVSEEHGNRTWNAEPADGYLLRITEKSVKKVASFHVEVGLGQPVGMNFSRDDLDTAFAEAHMLWRMKVRGYLMSLKPATDAQGRLLSETAEIEGNSNDRPQSAGEFRIEYRVVVSDREGLIVSDESKATFAGAEGLFQARRAEVPVGFTVLLVHGDREIFNVKAAVG